MSSPSVCTQFEYSSESIQPQKRCTNAVGTRRATPKSERRFAMAYWRLHYHLVWATWQRHALITDDGARVIEQAIYRKARELGLTIHQVGGMNDHVHVVATIPPRIAVADCVQQIKGASSYAVNIAACCQGSAGRRGTEQ
jgi:REP element-mobilizing transposase RayT